MLGESPLGTCAVPDHLLYLPHSTQGPTQVGVELKDGQLWPLWKEDWNSGHQALECVQEPALVQMPEPGLPRLIPQVWAGPWESAFLTGVTGDSKAC